MDRLELIKTAIKETDLELEIEVAERLLSKIFGMLQVECDKSVSIDLDQWGHVSVSRNPKVVIEEITNTDSAIVMQNSAKLKRSKCRVMPSMICSSSSITYYEFNGDRFISRATRHFDYRSNLTVIVSSKSFNLQ